MVRQPRWGKRAEAILSPLDCTTRDIFTIKLASILPSLLAHVEYTRHHVAVVAVPFAQHQLFQGEVLTQQGCVASQDASSPVKPNELVYPTFLIRKASRTSLVQILRQASRARLSKGSGAVARIKVARRWRAISATNKGSCSCHLIDRNADWVQVYTSDWRIPSTFWGIRRSIMLYF